MCMAAASAHGSSYALSAGVLSWCHRAVRTRLRLSKAFRPCARRVAGGIYPLRSAIVPCRAVPALAVSLQHNRGVCWCGRFMRKLLRGSETLCFGCPVARDRFARLAGDVHFYLKCHRRTLWLERSVQTAVRRFGRCCSSPHARSAGCGTYQPPCRYSARGTASGSSRIGMRL